MTAHILKMNDENTMKFIECYKNEPVLWDSTRDNYKKRELRAAAAKRIADEMDLEGFTEVHVMMKFKNLRSSYLQELKKISESKQSGCSTDEVYTPKVIWFSTMDLFLRPHVKSRNAHSNWEELNTIEDEHAESIDQLYEYQPSTSNDGREPTQKRKLQTDTPTTPQMKTIRLNPADAGIISAMETLDEISKRAAAHIKKEDSFDFFGKYIASLLRCLPEDRSSYLQAVIVSMILKPTKQRTIVTANQIDGHRGSSIETD